MPTRARLALMTATQIIELLDLKPHPEGGHFRETFRDEAFDYRARGGRERAASTSIYFLLARGERSYWHRIDAAEVWHYYTGAPLALEVADTNPGPIRRIRLGIDLAAGERPQAVVPRRAWQAAESLGDWTLGRLHRGAGIRIHGLRVGTSGVDAGATITRAAHPMERRSCNWLRRQGRRPRGQCNASPADTGKAAGCGWRAARRSACPMR